MDLRNKEYLVTVGGSLASLAVSGRVVRESLWGAGSGWAELEIKWRVEPLEDEESGEIGLAYMNSLGDGKIKI